MRMTGEGVDEEKLLWEGTDCEKLDNFLELLLSFLLSYSFSDIILPPPTTSSLSPRSLT
jgi:hypothetical protein